jgi:hypothetical protein
MRTTIAIVTTVKIPAHQRQQCHCNEGKVVSSTTSNQQATWAMMLAQQWWRHLRIDNGDNTIVMRATITSATMAKMPAH